MYVHACSKHACRAPVPKTPRQLFTPSNMTLESFQSKTRVQSIQVLALDRLHECCAEVAQFLMALTDAMSHSGMSAQHLLTHGSTSERVLTHHGMTASMCISMCKPSSHAQDGSGSARTHTNALNHVAVPTDAKAAHTWPHYGAHRLSKTTHDARTPNQHAQTTNQHAQTQRAHGTSTHDARTPNQHAQTTPRTPTNDPVMHARQGTASAMQTAAAQLKALTHAHTARRQAMDLHRS